MVMQGRAGKLALALTLAIQLTLGLGGQAAAADQEFLWRVDTQQKQQLPRNFRTTDDAVKLQGEQLPSLQGLQALHESGSAQFSEGEYQELMKRLPVQTIIVDLRQESHGIVNGHGLSWYKFNRNWANVGKTMDAVLQDEQQRIHGTQGATITIAELGADKRPAAQQEIQVVSALTEAEFVSQHHQGYFRITATDHLRPTDENVDRFLSFYKTLPKNAWLHFHCQAGQGRTTTFMAMYDMLHNAKQVSFADIIKRQYLLGGENLLKEAGAAGWKAEAAQQRIAFLRQFYEYAQQSPDNLPVTWSVWLKQHQ